MKYTIDSNEFVYKDMITGKKVFNPLNKRNLTETEMDEIFIGDY